MATENIVQFKKDTLYSYCLKSYKKFSCWMRQYCSLIISIYYLMSLFCICMRLWVWHGAFVLFTLEDDNRQATKQSYFEGLSGNYLKTEAKYHGISSAYVLRLQNPCNGGTHELLHTFPASDAEFEECNAVLRTRMKVSDWAL